MPFGSMIIKDNFAEDGSLASTTLMYKRSAYDLGAHDWFWMKWLPDRTIEASGPVETCRDCHGMAEDNDYILTESISVTPSQ
jgi:hypothetical protein